MSGRIPQHFVDDLISRSDIVEVINSRVQLKKAGREYKACCPFHNEKTPSFTVVPSKQFYHCFGCGANGSVLGFLMQHDHMSFVEAIEELASLAGVDVPREAGNEQRPRDDGLYQLLEQTSQHYVSQLKQTQAAVDYLKGRGITGTIAKEYGLGYAADNWDGLTQQFGSGKDVVERLQATGMVISRDHGGVYDRFRGRVMFPIRDVRGRVIAFGGRILGSGEPKYLNSPETTLFHKGMELYGLYEARKALRDIDSLIVVEGYMDVVGLAQHGIRNAVATLGTATTVEHLRRIFRITQEVVFCFDGDRAGRAAAWRALVNALPEVREGREIRFLFVPDGHDPDSLVQEEGETGFQARLKKAVPLSDYLVSELVAQVDLSTVEGRAKFAELGRPLVNRIPEGVYRSFLLDRLAQTVRMDGYELNRLLLDPERPQSAPRRRKATKLTVGRGNLVRQAIGMLLWQPGLAKVANAMDLGTLRRSQETGHRLLVRLLDDALETPGLTTAGFLERWRDQEEGVHLQKLVQARLSQVGLSGALTEEGLEQEFKDLLRRLQSAVSPEREKMLLEKLSQEGLSEEEMKELKALHAARNSESGGLKGFEAEGH